MYFYVWGESFDKKYIYKCIYTGSEDVGTGCTDIT